MITIYTIALIESIALSLLIASRKQDRRILICLSFVPVLNIFMAIGMVGIIGWELL